MKSKHRNNDIILEEMGLKPLWKLRASSSEPSSTARPEPVQASQPVAQPIAQTDSTINNTVPVFDSKKGEPISSSPATETETEKTTWEQLLKDVSECRACTLCAQRKQAVPGIGDRSPDWLIVGEGPGAEEDLRGEPFVGQAGKLLDNMLAAIDLKRGEKVYIANAVKCRPPSNRAPTVEEIHLCRPFLIKQIDLLKPKIIVLLGKTATLSVLQHDHPLGAQRGKPFDFQGIPVVVTYHPAYLLRNLPDKIKAWEDLIFAQQVLQK